MVPADLLLTVLEKLPIGVMLYDGVFEGEAIVDFKCVALNGAATQIAQLDRLELLHQNLIASFPIIKDQGVFDVFVTTMLTGQTLQEEFYIPTEEADTEGRWFSLHIQRVEEHLMVTFQDISLRKQFEAQLVAKAYRDELSGLYSRHYYFTKVPQLLALAAREGWQVGLLYFDLDGFKRVNDTFGHAAGDQVLLELAKRWQNICRESDVLFRIGGDEFGLFLSNTTDQEAKEVANRFVVAVDASIDVNDTQITLGVSVGIVVSEGDSLSVDQLLDKADALMYEAKRES